MSRVLAVLAVAGLGALAALSGPAGGAAKPACGKGQTAWKIEGKVRCAPVPSRRPSANAGSEAALITERLLRRAVAPLPGGRTTRLTRGMRRMLTTGSGNPIIAAVRGIEAQVLTTATSASARPRATQTITAPGFSRTQGDTTMSGTASATVSDTGEAVIDIGLRLSQGKASTEMKVGLEMESRDNSRVCPDENGRVIIKRNSGGSLTTLVRNGGRVESAETTRARTVTQTIGQLDATGALSTVTTRQTSTASVFRRGLQMEIVTTTAVVGPPDSPGRSAGTPTVDAKVTADDLSVAEARAVERAIASKAVADQTDARTEAGISEVGRDELRELAKKWVDDTASGANKCLKIVFSPPGAVMKVGETKGVTAVLTLADGGTPVDAQWSVAQVVFGQFSGGPMGAFTAVGGPGDTGYSVVAAVVATSIAGRVRANWEARNQPSYKVVFDAKGRAETATHDATARLFGTLFATAEEGTSPPRATASGPVDWADIVFTTKIGCPYIDPVSGGTWGVTITSLPDGTIRVRWTADEATRVTASVDCPPDGENDPPPIPGQPGPRPLGVEPVEFILPASGGTQPLTGSVTSEDGGFYTDGTIVVTPNL